MNPKPDLNLHERGGFQPKRQHSYLISEYETFQQSTAEKTNLFLRSGAVSLYSRLRQANRFARWQNHRETFRF